MSSQTRVVRVFGQQMTFGALVVTFKSIYGLNIPELAEKLGVEGVDKRTLRACAYAGGGMDVKQARKLESRIQALTQGATLPPLSPVR